MGRKPNDCFKKTKKFTCRTNYYFENVLNNCVKKTGYTKSDVVYEALKVYYQKLKSENER